MHKNEKVLNEKGLENGWMRKKMLHQKMHKCMRERKRERRTEEKDSVEKGRSDPQQRPFFPQQQETE